MSERFDRGNFNEYYRDIIDNYQEKELGVVGNFYGSKIKLKVFDYSQDWILVKKKR